MKLGLYRHYKGGYYNATHIAKHSESGEDYVVYVSMRDDQVWVRPASMFTELLNIDGVTVNRFTLVG